MAKFCESITLVRHEKKSKVRQLPSVAKNLISRLPWNVKYVKSKEMMRAIFDILNTQCFDIIHFDDIYMASNLNHDSKDGPKKVVTFHDIESVRSRRTFMVEKNLYRKLTILLNWLAVQTWEKQIIGKFDLCISVSPVDCGILKSKHAKAKIAVIPNGADTDSFSTLPLNHEEDNISFIGTMEYPPNKDAALYFCKQIFPIIKSKLPRAKFFIVGQNPDKELRELSSDLNVIVTGYVESVIPYYEKTSVVVVPLRAGGGTRGKILEAMALGRPVVSTSLGAEGLEVTDKENIMIADRPEDFATITVDLMRNGSFKSALIESARKFVESQHNWRKIAEELDQAYQETCLGN